MSQIHGIRGPYRVDIRRRRGWVVRPEAEALDGRVFLFRPGWTITSEERGQYAGEMAMIPVYDDPAHPYPDDGPTWIASGDLVHVDSLPAADLVEQAAR